MKNLINWTLRLERLSENEKLLPSERQELILKQLELLISETTSEIEKSMEGLPALLMLHLSKYHQVGSDRTYLSRLEAATEQLP